MGQNLIYLLLIFCFAQEAIAQKVVLSGYVTDGQSGEKLAGANIIVEALKMGTITNEFGYYSILLPADSMEVTYSTLGYEKRKVQINLIRNIRYDVELTFNNILQEITVSPLDESDIVSSTQAGMHKIAGQVFRKSTMLLGESDVLRTLQILPGVKGGSEGSTGLFVRGGTPDQNLILLDGIPVYNVNHLFGFLSTFNSDAVKDVILYKGGIPARFGNRLSSVLDISLKEGNTKQKQGSFSITPIAGRFTFEGPISKKKSSYIVSFRRTWLDKIITSLMPSDQRTSYSFYDFNAKFNHHINHSNHIVFSVYTGRDQFFSKVKFGDEKATYSFNWGNAAYALRWSKIFNPRLHGTFLLYRSNYFFTQESKFTSSLSRQINRVKSTINDISVQADFEQDMLKTSKLRFGAKISVLSFFPEINQIATTTIDTTINNASAVNAVNSELYIEQESKLHDKVLMNIGFREAIFSVQGKTYLAHQPRLSLTYLITKQTSVKGSINKMTQFVHLLANSSLRFPTDLWVPSTKHTKPEQAVQYSAAITHRLPKKNLEGSVEVYFKQMYNLLEYRDGANYLFGSKNWEEKVIYGEGNSYGAEFFINKKKGKTTGWLSYSLSFTDRKFEEINNGVRFPFKYDRRHEVSLFGNYEISSNKSFSTLFTLASGNLYTVPINSYQGILPPNYTLTNRYISGNYPNDFLNQELITNRNNFRMPVYHRLDINYQTSKKTKNNNTRSWLFSVYNLYNRQNPFLLYQTQGRLKKLALFPIVPSVGYRLDF